MNPRGESSLEAVRGAPGSEGHGCAPRALPYYPALDGLRALAVIGVWLFHDGHLVGGYLGVDLFFVLSGFLLTSLLLVEWRTAGRIDLGAFWIRRARRLLPALFLVLAAVVGYAATLAAPTELETIREDGLATLGYVANWHAIASGSDYWALFGGARSPLDHAWSLAIEEQFYLVWPLVAILVLRLARGRRGALLTVCLALALASAVAMLLLFDPEASARAYQGTDTRATALLVGAAFACRAAPGRMLGRSSVSPWLDGAGLVALVGLAVAWVLLKGESPLLYRGGFWLTQAAVLVLIAAATEAPTGRLARALGSAPLVAIGRVSYGVYLWHWPIFVVLRPERVGFDGLGLTALRALATAVLAATSYALVEKPLRAHGLGRMRAAIAVPVSIGALVLGLFSATAPPHDVGEDGSTAPYATRVLVVGDSLAGSLATCMRPQAAAMHARIFGEPGGCSILHDQFPLNPKQRGGDCDRTWFGLGLAVRPHVTAVVLGGGYFASAKIDGRWQHACQPGWTREYRRELEIRLRELARHSGAVVLALVPYYKGKALAHIADPPRVDCFNDTLRDIAQAVPGVTLIDLMGEVCPGGVCKVDHDGQPIRKDGVHFSLPGCSDIAHWALDALLATGRPADLRH